MNQIHTCEYDITGCIYGSMRNLPAFIPTLEITELNPYILTKSALSTDAEGKDSQEGGMHDEGAAAVQHLVQVRCLERHLPRTRGYYGIQRTVWLVAEGKS